MRKKTVPEDVIGVAPLERNTLEERRHKLGLSRAQLAAVFEVAISTVLRKERDTVMDAVWDWALRGIEADYADRRRALDMEPKSPPPPPPAERPAPAPKARVLPKSWSRLVERAIVSSAALKNDQPR
jgi:hypothetical protein